MSHGGFINWIGFKTRPEMEGTVYEGKWAEEAPTEEIFELLEGWEQEVQDMVQVRCFRPQSQVYLAKSPWFQCVEKPTRWVVNMIANLPFSVRGRVAILGDAVSTICDVPRFLTAELIFAGACNGDTPRRRCWAEYRSTSTIPVFEMF